MTALIMISLLAISSQEINVAHQNQVDYFYADAYPEDQDTLDDSFCKALAKVCPFLRSPTARPSQNQAIPVNVNVT